MCGRDDDPTQHDVPRMDQRKAIEILLAAARAHLLDQTVPYTMDEVIEACRVTEYNIAEDERISALIEDHVAVLRRVSRAGVCE